MPIHTPAELARLKAEDRELITFEGQQITKYDASQKQRKPETAMCHCDDRITIAKAAIKSDAGREMYEHEKERMRFMVSKYRELSSAAGLPIKMERTVSYVKSGKRLTSGGGGGRIEIKYNTYGDHLRKTLGKAFENNKKEAEELVKYVENHGGVIKFNNIGKMVYNAAGSGKPGTIDIDKNCSIAALKHEFRHFIDDEDSGFIGIKVIYDSDEYWRREFNGYMEELRIAHKYKDYDAGKAILEEMRARKREIYGID